MKRTCSTSFSRPAIAIILLTCAILGPMLPACRGAEPGDDHRKTLPAGCFITRYAEVPADQAAAIGKKFGAAIERITNTWLTVQGAPIQVNVVVGNTEADAIAVHKAISATKRNPAFCLRNGRQVIEFVGNDATLAIKTAWELGFTPKPKNVHYRLTAQIATVDKSDYMAANDLFNLFLSAQSPQASANARERIAAMAGRFQFGHTLTLRELNTAANDMYSFTPQPDGKPQSLKPGTVSYTFANPATSMGVSNVTLVFDAHVDDTGLTATERKADPSLLAPTAWWPADDPRFVNLARQITASAGSQTEKVQKLLAWLSPGGGNMKFGGPVTGSRWGAAKVMQQKFGQCWDFSDVFITLCRAAGIPCRQVAGWLYGGSGHVWAEVLVEGKGWQQVDPTGGGKLACGIYHIPYFTSEDGEMPVLYIAWPKIETLETK